VLFKRGLVGGSSKFLSRNSEQNPKMTDILDFLAKGVKRGVLGSHSRSNLTRKPILQIIFRDISKKSNSVSTSTTSAGYGQTFFIV
jgi:hypothetical protein